MFAIHSGQNAAAICPQLTATAVICSSSLLQPTNPLEPVETLPPTPPALLPCSSQALKWTGRLSSHSIPMFFPRPLRKRVLKMNMRQFLPTFDSEKPKDFVCTQRNVFLSNAMPLPENAWEACTRPTLFRCPVEMHMEMLAGQGKRIGLHCGSDSRWQIGCVRAEHR